MKKGYNGWKNYQTWATHLWLIQNFDFSDAIKEQEKTTSQAGRVFALADEIERAIREERPKITGVYSDLLTFAMSEIDYVSIARHFLYDMGKK